MDEDYQIFLELCLACKNFFRIFYRRYISEKGGQRDFGNFLMQKKYNGNVPNLMFFDDHREKMVRSLLIFFQNIFHHYLLNRIH